jgi:hypothetical protein
MDSRQGGNRRIRGLAAWKPNADTRPILDDIEAVLAEDRAEWPLGPRSIEYRLLDRGYKKTSNRRADLAPSAHDRTHLRKGTGANSLYDKVTDVLTRARRSGRISMDAIADDADVEAEPFEFDGEQAFFDDVRSRAEQYRRALLSGQAVIPELWCEARGMLARTEAIAFEYGVSVRSSGGTDHLKPKYDLAVRAVRRFRAGQRTVVLHIGDWDAAGRIIFAALAEDVTEIARDLYSQAGSMPRDLITFKRLALTRAQALSLHRAGKSQGLDAGGQPMVQAEAIAPLQRARLIRNAIEGLLDMNLFARTKARGERERRSILRKVA